jgi:hypothetical protein
VIVKRDRGVYIIDLKREIFKPILKLRIFTAHGIMEFLPEFGLGIQIQKDLRFAA